MHTCVHTFRDIHTETYSHPHTGTNTDTNADSQTYIHTHLCMYDTCKYIHVSTQTQALNLHESDVSTLKPSLQCLRRPGPSFRGGLDSPQTGVHHDSYCGPEGAGVRANDRFKVANLSLKPSCSALWNKSGEKVGQGVPLEWLCTWSTSTGLVGPAPTWELQTQRMQTLNKAPDTVIDDSAMDVARITCACCACIVELRVGCPTVSLDLLPCTSVPMPSFQLHAWAFLQPSPESVMTASSGPRYVDLTTSYRPCRFVQPSEPQMVSKRRGVQSWLSCSCVSMVP